MLHAGLTTGRTSCGAPSSRAEPTIASIRLTAFTAGWDFSSRWLADGMNLSTIRTTKVAPNPKISPHHAPTILQLKGCISGPYFGISYDGCAWNMSTKTRARETTCLLLQIVPADLNAYLYDMERNIASFARQLDNASLAAQYTTAAEKRAAAIQALMWDASAGECAH